MVLLRTDQAAGPGPTGPEPIAPVLVHDGLAVYDVGQGEPLLLLPYPHGYTDGPMAGGTLARLLVGLGWRVISFDPPGAYRSTRSPQMDMPEMLGCALEALRVRESGSEGDGVDVVGHSMGGLCALAFALEYPHQVKRLVLVGALSGRAALMRWGGWHLQLPWWTADFWRYVVWGMRLMAGRGSLALHKRHDHLMAYHSYVDRSKVPPLRIEEGDEHRPAPVRDRWPTAVRHLDYAGRLDEVRAPVLVLVGRHDPQTPLPCSEELARGLADAQLIILEKSGHAPFDEEPDRFVEAAREFLG